MDNIILKLNENWFEYRGVLQKYLQTLTKNQVRLKTVCVQNRLNC